MIEKMTKAEAKAWAEECSKMGEYFSSDEYKRVERRQRRVPQDASLTAVDLSSSPR